MAKDPAFLFYSSDFITGVADLTMEERGQYITLLCIQHQKGRLSSKAVAIAVPNAAADVLAKFTEDENGLLYNERLEIEAEKRKQHAEKQRQRALDGWKKRKEKKEIQPITMADAAALPLEDVNENEIEVVIKEEVNIWTDSNEEFKKFLCKKFGVNEVNQFQNYALIKRAISIKQNQGVEQYNWFKGQCFLYFLYKEKSKQTTHGLKSFIGELDEIDLGNWNAENWDKKYQALKQQDSTEPKANVQPNAKHRIGSPVTMKQLIPKK